MRLAVCVRMHAMRVYWCKSIPKLIVSSITAWIAEQLGIFVQQDPAGHLFFLALHSSVCCVCCLGPARTGRGKMLRGQDAVCPLENE